MIKLVNRTIEAIESRLWYSRIGYVPSRTISGPVQNSICPMRYILLDNFNLNLSNFDV